MPTVIFSFLLLVIFILPLFDHQNHKTRIEVKSLNYGSDFGFEPIVNDTITLENNSQNKSFSISDMMKNLLEKDNNVRGIGLEKFKPMIFFDQFKLQLPGYTNEWRANGFTVMAKVNYLKEVSH